VGGLFADLMEVWACVWGAAVLVVVVCSPALMLLAVYVQWLAMQALRKYLGKPPLRLWKRGGGPGEVQWR